MTDVGVDTGNSGAVVANIQAIPLTKIKGESVEVNFDELPIEVYKEMLFLGAKEYINSVGMSKIGAGLTKLNDAEKAKAHEAIKAQAAKNVEAMTTGSGFKFHGAKASGEKVPAAVNLEAMRIARNLVKDWMKSTGRKIAHTPASEITAGAKAILAADPSIYKTAEAALKARAETPIKGIDLSSIVKADPKMVEKAEAKKASKKKEGTPLSAKQAGLVAPRQKPSKPSGATAH